MRTANCTRTTCSAPPKRLPSNSRKSQTPSACSPRCAIRSATSSARSKEKEGKDAATFTALGELIEQIAIHGAEQAQAFSTLSGSHSKLQAAHDKLHAEFTALVKKLGETDSSYTTRPPVTGGAGQSPR